MSASPNPAKLSAAPSSQELVDRARALVPALRERAARADRERRIPDETIRELLDLGLLQMQAPRRFGGFQESFLTFLDVSLELARGCGSTAWLFGLLCNHHWILSHFSLQAQTDVYGGKDHAFFPHTPSGKGGVAKVADGGYRVSGQWSFATGIDFADWVSCTAPIDKENPHPLNDRLNFLIPRKDIEVVDTWFTSGMRGTGSRDFIVKDAFVPQHRVITQGELQSGRSPGRAALEAEYPGMAMPYFTALLSSVLAPTLGLTRRTIDDYAAYTKTRTGIGGISHVNRATTQSKIGYAQARYDAMYRTARAIFQETEAAIAAGTKISAEQRIRHRRDAAYVGDECTKVIDSLISSAGSRGQMESSPFQQIQRDIHTIRTHVVFDLEDATEAYGRQMLGLPIEPLRF